MKTKLFKTLGTKVEEETYFAFNQIAGFEALNTSELLREMINKKIESSQRQITSSQAKPQKIRTHNECVDPKKDANLRTDINLPVKKEKKDLLTFFKEEKERIELDKDPKSRNIKKIALGISCLAVIFFGKRN